MRLEENVLKELMESEAFCNGVEVGINLHQQKVVMASKYKSLYKLMENYTMCKTAENDCRK